MRGWNKIVATQMQDVTNIGQSKSATRNAGPTGPNAPGDDVPPAPPNFHAAWRRTTSKLKPPSQTIRFI
ncbi:hypothetical protein SBV1_340006 [Verrucomicrobia bacterium]|nr:hypothetical protein SBV1_340006 [Verrucomicrobiota bacterium]